MNEITEVCASLAESFVDDPFYQAITVEAPNDFVRRNLLTRYFEVAVAEAEEIGEVQYTGADGAALWLTGERDQTTIAAAGDRRKKALAGLLGAQGLSSYLSICSGMSNCLPPELDGAWYLSILGVRTKARGKGTAQMLLERTLQRADALGATCYLETFNPLSLPFYHRLGFGGEMTFREPVTSREYWLLVR